MVETFQLARPMTPTAQCITIQLREFSWYYWYRYVSCDREIQNFTAGTRSISDVRTWSTFDTRDRISKVWQQSVRTDFCQARWHFLVLTPSAAVSPHKMKYWLIIIVIAVVAPAVYRRLFGWFIVSAQTQPLVQASYPAFIQDEMITSCIKTCQATSR